MRINLAFDPVKAALEIDRLVMCLDERTRTQALDIVWFYHVGRHLEWGYGRTYYCRKLKRRKR